MTSTNIEASTTASSAMNARPIIIYALAGSQFVHKVLVGLAAKKIEHFVQLVPFGISARRAAIPSGGELVPELQVGLDPANREIVTDSEAILHWFDDHMQTNFFPNEQASEISQRASYKPLAALVWYYNWVDDKGYANSMRKTFGLKLLPTWLPFRDFLLDQFFASARVKFQHKVMEAMEIDVDTIKDEPKMRQILVEELKFFQSLLTKPSAEQPYLIAGTDQPTAADCSVFAQVERLVGGTSTDVTISPCVPELKENEPTKTDLHRLWEWHDLMCEKFPVRFLGKRPPVFTAPTTTSPS